MSKFSDATFYLTPSGYGEGKVYPQKPLTTTGEITFTRASSAWRTNLEGQIEESPYNLLSYSEDLSNAVWSSGISGTGVSPVKSYNTVIAPNGTLTADTIVFDRGAGNTLSDSSAITQYFTDTALTTYTFSIWVKASTVSDVGKQIFLRIGAAGTLPSRTLTSDWTRISTTQTNTTAGGGAYVQFGNRGTVTSGNSVSVDVWGAQIVRGSLPKNYLATTNRQNFPRIDYSSGRGALLLEPIRTNIHPYSSAMYNMATFAQSGATGPIVTQATGILDPQGTTNAALVTGGSGSTGSWGIYQLMSTIIASGQQIAASVYVKAGTHNKIQLNHANISTVVSNRSSYFDLSNGTTPTAGASIQYLGNGWYRCFMPIVTLSADTITAYNIGCYITPDTTTNVWSTDYTGKSVYFYGIQVEAGGYSTSFIPTAAAVATRLSDVATKVGMSSLIGQTEGTIFIDVNVNSLDEIESFIAITDGTGTNRIDIYRWSTNLIYVDRVSPTQSSLTSYSSGTITRGRYKIAFAYKSGDSALYINGSIVSVTQTATFTMNTLSILYIGNNWSGSRTPTNDSFNQVALFTTRYTNADLAKLTTL